MVQEPSQSNESRRSSPAASEAKASQAPLSIQQEQGVPHQGPTSIIRAMMPLHRIFIPPNTEEEEEDDKQDVEPVGRGKRPPARPTKQKRPRTTYEDEDSHMMEATNNPMLQAIHQTRDDLQKQRQVLEDLHKQQLLLSQQIQTSRAEGGP